MQAIVVFLLSGWVVQPLEDPPQPFVSRQPATEAQRDRQEALELFAAGRMLERRQDLAGALRKYQRALRRDPQATTVCNALLQSALRLKRLDEAARHALVHRPPAPEAVEVMLYLRLAAHLAEDSQWGGALDLYEKVRAARSTRPPTEADVYLDLELGRLHHLVGNYARSAECFARVFRELDRPEPSPRESSKKKPATQQALLYVLIGESFLLADRPREAQEAFAKAETLDPQPGPAAYRRARVLLRTGQADKAAAALESYFQKRQSSEGLGPYELLAEIFKRQGRSGELISRLETLHAADPANLPLGYALAEQYQKQGRLDRAEPLYRALLDKSPSLTGYRALAEIYLKQQQAGRLLAILGQVAGRTLALDDLQAELEKLRANSALVAGVLEAGRKKRHAQPATPDFGAALAAALVALECKQFAAADEFFAAAVAADAKRAGPVLLLWGSGLLSAGETQRAIAALQQGLKEKRVPRSEGVLQSLLAGGLALAGRHDEALAAARKAAELAASSPRMQARPAWILYHGKRHAEAERAYRELVARFDGQQSAEARDMLREARLVLSNLAVIAGRRAEAEDWLEQLLDEFPDDISALNDLGYLWAERGVHLGRALPMIQRAVEAEPRNAAYRDSLGWVYYQLGRHGEAVVELEKAVAGEKPDGVILDHLGDALLKVGQPDKARAAWQRAAARFQAEKEPEKARRCQAKLDERSRKSR